MTEAKELHVERRIYRRERYACHLRLTERRVIKRSERFGEKERVIRVMTRWLARCFRDQPVVTGTARLELMRDYITFDYLLRAEVYVFRDVDTRDIKSCSMWVNNPTYDVLGIPDLGPEYS